MSARLVVAWWHRDTHLAIDTVDNVDIIDIISTTEQRSVTSGPAGSTAGCGGA